MRARKREIYRRTVELAEDLAALQVQNLPLESAIKKKNMCCRSQDEERVMARCGDDSQGIGKG